MCPFLGSSFWDTLKGTFGNIMENGLHWVLGHWQGNYLESDFIHLGDKWGEVKKKSGKKEEKRRGSGLSKSIKRIKSHK